MLDDAALEELATWAIAYGRRYFDFEPPSRDLLRTHMSEWLSATPNGILLILEDGLITEREARDLLLQRIHDFYRPTMSRGGIIGMSSDDIENLAQLDIALFGKSPLEYRKLGLIRNPSSK